MVIHPLIAAQLHTLRDFTKDASQLGKTLKRIRSIGYRAAQFPCTRLIPDEEMARVMRCEGIAPAASHVEWNGLVQRADQIIETHQAWGCRNAAISSLPLPYFSREGIERFRREFEPIAAKFAEANITLSYHNFTHELNQIDGKPWLLHLFDAIPGERLGAELDVYWIAKSGADPASLIQSCSGRMPLLNIKDTAGKPPLSISRNNQGSPAAHGRLDWSRLLRIAQENGVEWVLVEQDYCYNDCPFDSLELSYQFLCWLRFQMSHSSEAAEKIEITTEPHSMVPSFERAAERRHAHLERVAS